MGVNIYLNCPTKGTLSLHDLTKKFNTLCDKDAILTSLSIRGTISDKAGKAAKGVAALFSKEKTPLEQSVATAVKLFDRQASHVKSHRKGVSTDTLKTRLVAYITEPKDTTKKELVSQVKAFAKREHGSEGQFSPDIFTADDLFLRKLVKSFRESKDPFVKHELAPLLLAAYVNTKESVGKFVEFASINIRISDDEFYTKSQTIYNNLAK